MKNSMFVSYPPHLKKVACVGKIAAALILIYTCITILYHHCQSSYDAICRHSIFAEFILNRYQTLLTGIFALVVGWQTVKRITEQIDDQRQGRWEERIAASDAYVAVIRNYHEEIYRIFGIVNRKNNLNDDGTSKVNPAAVFCTIMQEQWDYMPKSIPEIILDWYFLAELPRADVTHMIEISKCMKNTNRCINTLNPRGSGTNELSTETVTWQNLIKNVNEEKKTIDEHITAIQTKHRDARV